VSSLPCFIPVDDDSDRFGISPEIRSFDDVEGNSNENEALRRNPAGWLIDGAFRYTLQFEEQRLDEDSGMAGLPGVSERDQ